MSSSFSLSFRTLFGTFCSYRFPDDGLSASIYVGAASTRPLAAPRIQGEHGHPAGLKPPRDGRFSIAPPCISTFTSIFGDIMFRVSPARHREVPFIDTFTTSISGAGD